MNHQVITEAFSEFKEFKSIDRTTMMSILKDVFGSMIKKKYGTDENFDVILNPDKGDIQIFWNRTVVDDEFAEDSFDFDPNRHISLTEVRKLEPDLDIDEEYTEEVTLESFGRRNILTARQNLKSRIMELEKEGIYQKYKDRVGDIVTAEIYQVFKKEMLLKDDEGNELILPKNETIPSDFFKKGDAVRAVIVRVEMQGGNPKIILSRTSPLFLERLFELEVPEIFDGLITIKKIVREPGERAKVAVESYDDRIDPVGACVGMKGSRIHGIVRELRNENIDVINYTNNIQLLIQRALAPAKISSLKIDDETKRVSVFMRPDQVSLAIGKGGHNIRLAGKLTGYEIDVYRDSDDESEDVDLDEFADEIDEWIIEELKKIGCDTAKDVIQLSVEDLVKRTDLEKETIEEVMKILNAEFE